MERTPDLDSTFTVMNLFNELILIMDLLSSESGVQISAIGFGSPSTDIQSAIGSSNLGHSGVSGRGEV